MTASAGFGLVGRYFWLLALLISAINYVIAHRHLDTSPTFDASTRASAIEHLQWFALFGSVPWVVMGVGELGGFTPTVWVYFRPQDGNPFVLLWFAILFTSSVVYAYWIFAMDGARKVYDFELMYAFSRRATLRMPKVLIKVLAALGPPILLLWCLVVMSIDMPLPRF